MRQLAYFLSNLSAGINRRDAWHKATEQTQADKPRLIDRSMDSEEWDNWPVDGKLYDTSGRKTIWQILSKKS